MSIAVPHDIFHVIKDVFFSRNSEIEGVTHFSITLDFNELPEVRVTFIPTEEQVAKTIRMLETEYVLVKKNDLHKLLDEVDDG